MGLSLNPRRWSAGSRSFGQTPRKKPFNWPKTSSTWLATASARFGRSSKRTRIRVSDGKRVVTDGPFTEAKELIAGFWIIQVKSKEEAIEWAKRCPLPEGGVIEIRQVFENSDFPPELQKKIAGA